MMLVIDAVAAGLPGAPQEQVQSRAVSAWSTCHGFATLYLAEVIANRPELPPLQAMKAELAAGVAAAALPP